MVGDGLPMLKSPASQGRPVKLQQMLQHDASLAPQQPSPHKFRWRARRCWIRGCGRTLASSTSCGCSPGGAASTAGCATAGAPLRHAPAVSILPGESTAQIKHRAVCIDFKMCCCDLDALHLQSAAAVRCYFCRSNARKVQGQPYVQHLPRAQCAARGT